MAEPNREAISDQGFSQANKLTAELAEIQPDQPAPAEVPAVDSNKEFTNRLNSLMPKYQAPDANGRKKYERQLETAAKILAKSYPDQLEAITIFTNLPAILEAGDKVDDSSLHNKRKLPLYRELTEYQYLLTHFALENADKPEVMQNLWSVAGNMAARMDKSKDFQARKAGALTAAAAHHLFSTLGKQPELSHPDEDAFDAIDLWVEDEHSAVQIMKSDAEEVTISRTDDVLYPGIAVEGDQVSQHFSVNSPVDKALRFRTKLAHYAQEHSQPVEGYFLQIPYSQIDSQTGVPSPVLVEQMRAKLDTIRPWQN